MRVPRIGLPVAGLLLVIGLLAPSGVFAVDPEGSWWSAGSVSVPRIFTTLTRLQDGTALAIGGQDGQGETSTYGGTTRSRTAGAVLRRSRSHAAVLGHPPPERQGVRRRQITTIPGHRNVVASTAIYDPATNSWSAGTPMPLTRYLHTATEHRRSPDPGRRWHRRHRPVGPNQLHPGQRQDLRPFDRDVECRGGYALLPLRPHSDHYWRTARSS